MQPSLAARFRLTAIMTLFVYPLVTVLLYVLAPLTPGWEIWQRSLILVPVMASTIVLLLVPFITRRFGAFIAGKKTVAATA
jgi:antibiotic biosynthesis monooxygenase (ABM) superfamily enzyme